MAASVVTHRAERGAAGTATVCAFTTGPLRTYRTYVTHASQVGCPHRRQAPIQALRPSRDEARKRYVSKGELVALEQIKRDSELLAEHDFAVGPFARMDANAVAAQEGKTRGAINNVFGSQSAFQAETMALTLNAGAWIELLEFPDPNDFPDAETWMDALLIAESARGPHTVRSLM